ncbi:lipid II flippase MurJ [Diaminobutyricibacter sp. McL0608]|uniref:lipid II flippase MurJ n=1 Tax=Leifsonia sp. McL0608 TaxID=3143537 RepID=UPI0031F2DCF9
MMAYWCIPQVFFFVVFSVLGQILNAHRVFGPYAWAPIALNVVSVLGLGLFALIFPRENAAVGQWTPTMVALLCGTATLGVAVQSAILLPALRRIGFQFGFRGLKTTGRTAGLAFVGVLAGQAAYLVVSNVANLSGARLHDAGTVGASLNSLNNAYLVSLLPHGVLVVAISTSLFTQVSHSAASRDFDTVAADTVNSTSQIAFVSALFTTIFITSGTLIGSVLWNSPVIGSVLVLLSIGMTGFSQTYAMNRSALALRSGSSVLVTQTTVALITALSAGAALLVPVAMAVPVIATGISVANLVGGLVSTALVTRTLRKLGVQITTASLLRPQLSMTLSSIVVSSLGFAVVNTGIGIPENWWVRAGLLVTVVILTLLAVLTSAWLTNGGLARNWSRAIWKSMVRFVQRETQ